MPALVEVELFLSCDGIGRYAQQPVWGSGTLLRCAAGGPSSGERFDAAPNIDHAQAFVKRDICEWLEWLRAHAGFDGFR